MKMRPWWLASLARLHACVVCCGERFSMSNRKISINLHYDDGMLTIERGYRNRDRDAQPSKIQWSSLKGKPR